MSFIMKSNLSSIYLILVLLVLVPSVIAQFNFFQGGFPFGHQQQQQQQQQQHGGGGGGGGRQHRGWNIYEEVHCRAGYVCPSSLACVPTPADCPCPYPEDRKCVVPDQLDRQRDEGEGPPFVCVRGDGCAEVLEFSKPI